MFLTRVIPRFPLEQWFREAPSGFQVKNTSAAYIPTQGKARNTSGTQATVNRQVRNTAGTLVTVK